ncbi:MAG: hypothetical protein ACODAU_10690 [Myxococcota bacterium]
MTRRRFGRGAGPAMVGAAWLACVAGCSDLSEFQTSEGELYRGRVLGVDDVDTGSGSFIRAGFEAGTTLELEFDPDAADSREAGRIWTDDDACGGPTFDGTWLRAIPPLQHDALSLYDFPGGGRIRSYIHAARPDSGPLAGRTVMVFLSLIRGGQIELRVVSGYGAGACGDGDPSTPDCDCFFGVFHLDKEDVTP